MTQSKFGVCPLFTFEKIISGKWMLPVLHRVEQNDGIRFGALLRCFPEIAKATLTKQLRKLERVGFVSRTEREGYPRNVEYHLTAVGQEFLRVFSKVEDWCEIYLSDKAERQAKASSQQEGT
jgi:DNA-binding HxlR family transcriptional regulator